MTKVSILTIALLLSLPACMGNKNKTAQTNKKNKVEQSVDMFSSVEMASDFYDEDMEDDSDIHTFFDFDDESGEFTPGDESIELYNDNDSSDLISWVDAQDDEFKNIYFGFNHYGVRADQEKALSADIEQVKQMLAEADVESQPTIVIEGHACQEGTPAYNLALSEKRAKNVADLFVAAGVDKDTIKVVGRGQEVPVVINGKVVNG